MQELSKTYQINSNDFILKVLYGEAVLGETGITGAIARPPLSICYVIKALTHKPINYVMKKLLKKFENHIFKGLRKISLLRTSLG